MEGSVVIVVSLYDGILSKFYNMGCKVAMAFIGAAAGLIGTRR